LLVRVLWVSGPRLLGGYRLGRAGVGAGALSGAGLGLPVPALVGPVEARRSRARGR
jgi:hypothetical protein